MIRRSSEKAHSRPFPGVTYERHVSESQKRCQAFGWRAYFRRFPKIKQTSTSLAMDGDTRFLGPQLQWLARQQPRHNAHHAPNRKTLRSISIDARGGTFASYSRALRRPSVLCTSSIVISKSPVAVQSTAARRLNYPYCYPVALAIS